MIWLNFGYQNGNKFLYCHLWNCEKIIASLYKQKSNFAYQKVKTNSRNSILKITLTAATSSTAKININY